MRIAVVHSFYRSDQPSGENAIVLEQIEGLRAAGHDVLLVARHSDEEARHRGYRIRSAIQVATGSGPDPSADIAAFSPDVVHFHNLFPNFGRTWVRRLTVPMVATLHNFRAVCANGLLFRDGHVCFDCPRGNAVAAIRHRCYRDSFVATLPLAIQTARGVSADPMFEAASALICLSQPARSIFEGFGAPAETLTVVPNGIVDPGLVAAPVGNGRWLYAGRLSEEKGALELVRSWPADLELDVVGAGPQLPAHRAIAGPNIRYLGVLKRDDLLSSMAHYDGLVFPSACLEMQPTVVIEAMAMGLPVVARRGNAGADLVVSAGCGTTYGDAADLRTGLLAALTSREEMGVRGRAVFRSDFRMDRWIARLEATYERAVAGGDDEPTRGHADRR